MLLPELFPDLLPEMFPEMLPEEKLPENFFGILRKFFKFIDYVLTFFKKRNVTSNVIIFKKFLKFFGKFVGIFLYIFAFI